MNKAGPRSAGDRTAHPKVTVLLSSRRPTSFTVDRPLQIEEARALSHSPYHPSPEVTLPKMPTADGIYAGSSSNCPKKGKVQAMPCPRLDGHGKQKKSSTKRSGTTMTFGGAPLRFTLRRSALSVVSPEMLHAALLFCSGGSISPRSIIVRPAGTARESNRPAGRNGPLAGVMTGPAGIGWKPACCCRRAAQVQKVRIAAQQRHAGGRRFDLHRQGVRGVRYGSDRRSSHIQTGLGEGGG